MSKRRGTWTFNWTAMRDQIHAETMTVVKSGKCPICGGPLRRNSSLAGWWQCSNVGAIGFRKDASKPECAWQGFTE